MKQFASIPVWIMQLGDAVTQVNMPPWLLALRQTHWETLLEHGMPSRKDERFKYTNLDFLTQQSFRVAEPKESSVRPEEARPSRRRFAPPQAERSAVSKAIPFQTLIKQHSLPTPERILIVTMNGHLIPSLSDPLPQGLTISNISTAWQTHSDLIRNYFDALTMSYAPFVSLNTAVFADGLFLHLKAGCELAKPVQLLAFNDYPEASVCHPTNMIFLDPHSKLTLLETQVEFSQQQYLMNTVTHVGVAASAAITYTKTHKNVSQALHISHMLVQQKQDSQTTFTNIITDRQFTRDDLTVTLQEAGSDCRARGFYQLKNDHQYVDQHINIEHAAICSRSEMLYKGIVDTKARAVFNGRLHVQKQAQKTQAYQANHNILLSNQAEVYSKPELEIYANDVMCKHGATTGQLNEAAVFYFRARGIPKETAVNMLLQGFANEILQGITPPAIKKHVKSQLAFLHRGQDDES